MYFYTLLGIHIFLIFLWLYLKYKYHWSITRANLDQFFTEQHEKLNIEKTFDHFMGRIDPYKDVKAAVSQLDRHFDDVYMRRHDRTWLPMHMAEKKKITPRPDLVEVIINTSLNPNLKLKSKRS